MRTTSRTRGTALAAVVLGVTAWAGPALATDRSPVPVDLGGEPVDASTDTADPTELPAGLWSDELGAAESPQGTHQFSYRRTMADSTVHIGVIGASSDPSGDALEVTAAAPGVDCGSEDARPSSPVTQGTFGAALVIGPDEPGQRDSECLISPELTFTVSRGTSTSETDLPIAIRIVEEAPVEADLDALPAAPESPSFEPVPDGGTVEELEGSSSFADAPRPESGTTYAATLTEGDERLYRVSLGWGQSLSARVEVPVKDEAATEATAFTNPGVDLSVVDPLGDTFSDVLEGDEPTGYYADEPATLLQGTPPVAYLNRFEDVTASLPGDYWIAVAVQPAVDRDPVAVPVELTVVVQGEESGAPTYPGVVLAPDSSEGPDGYTPQTPYLVAQDRFSADPSDSPASSESADGGDGVTGRMVGGSALAVVSLLSLAAGGVVLRRRSGWSGAQGR